MCNPRKIRIKVAETIQEAWNEALTVTVVEENHVEHIERWRTPVTLNHTLGQGGAAYFGKNDSRSVAVASKPSQTSQRNIPGQSPDMIMWKFITCRTNDALKSGRGGKRREERR